MMDKTIKVAAARVMLGYTLAFLLAVLIQLVEKVRVVKSAKAKKSDTTEQTPKINRYVTDDRRLHAADRSLGNFLEWAPAFLTLFWTYLLVVEETPWTAIYWGWLYVAARFLYPVLAMGGGVTFTGAKPLILLATGPGYMVLIRLAAGIAWAVM